MKRIGLHGVARSGTTWIGNIFNSNPYITYKHQPLYSYAFKDFLNNSSKKSKILTFFEEISKSTDDYTNQETLIKTGLVPNFPKLDDRNIVVYKEARHHHIVKHLLEEDDEFKLVAIIRNPMATLWSWKNAPNEFKGEWDFNEEWRFAELKNEGLPENFYGYEKWKEAANIFEEVAELFPDRVHLINYTEFIKTPLNSTRDMFNHIGVDNHPQTFEFIEKSQTVSKGPYSVFREKVNDNDWMGNIDTEIVDYIENDLRGTNLEKYLK